MVCGGAFPVLNVVIVGVKNDSKKIIYFQCR